MREALDVGETRLKLRQDLQDTIGIMFDPEALGNLFGTFVWTSYKPNRLRGKHTGEGLLIVCTNSRGCPSKLRLCGFWRDFFHTVEFTTIRRKSPPKRSLDGASSRVVS